ncbi:Uncharacterized protein slp1 [Auxenochlorella protothecoides]|uniref:Uncharacterized protein slp1 n=1 Tax=Auxenochlorella protothecoides TaxID=3075 RepID=A0A087ST17_AUXPR|nr:Uncharacterized protein slp1 [Auxenochlorella protothecoides]KFM28871.1 Uncharacterized protein slp1 [Auxenochlorella protothecoides]
MPLHRRVELVQNELYSSRVKDFEVYARQSNPRQDAGGDLAAGLANPLWRMVGNFTAPKTKGLQRFELQHPGWARYVLVRFLTHYSSEPVCAMNGIAVYGKSAAEELEDELAQELKATKLQTKSLARIVSDMQANHTGSMVALQAGLETVKREQASLLRELDDLRAQVFMLWIAVGSLSLCVCAPTILRAVQKLPLRTTIAALIIGVGAFESYRVLML